MQLNILTTENQIKELFKIHFLYIAFYICKSLDTRKLNETSLFLQPVEQIHSFHSDGYVGSSSAVSPHCNFNTEAKQKQARHYHSSQKGIGNTY